MELWNVVYYDKKIWEYGRNQNALSGEIKAIYKHHTIKISCPTLTKCNDAKCRTLTAEAGLKIRKSQNKKDNSSER